MSEAYQEDQSIRALLSLTHTYERSLIAKTSRVLNTVVVLLDETDEDVKIFNSLKISVTSAELQQLENMLSEVYTTAMQYLKDPSLLATLSVMNKPDFSRVHEALLVRAAKCLEALRGGSLMGHYISAKLSIHN